MSGRRHRPDRALRDRCSSPSAIRSASTWPASTRAQAWRSPVERGFFRLLGRRSAEEQDWKGYGKTVLVFSVLFWGVLYAILRLQGHLFL